MGVTSEASVTVQTSPEAIPAVPVWFGEVALVASHFRKQGILNKIGERVRFARRRFGPYEMIDFLAVLFGYAISGETHPGGVLPTPSAFCGSVHGLI